MRPAWQGNTDAFYAPTQDVPLKRWARVTPWYLRGTLRYCCTPRLHKISARAKNTGSAVHNGLAWNRGMADDTLKGCGVCNAAHMDDGPVPE